MTGSTVLPEEGRRFSADIPDRVCVDWPVTDLAKIAEGRPALVHR